MMNRNYPREKERPDGTNEVLMKDREGRVACRRIFNSKGQVVERIDYDTEGNISGRAVYEQDGHRKPLKTTAYDGKATSFLFRKEESRPFFMVTIEPARLLL